jgi:hypothetical protein
MKVIDVEVPTNPVTKRPIRKMVRATKRRPDVISGEKAATKRIMQYI